MAKLPNGILGDFLGKAGPVTGYMRYGQNILRSSKSRSDNIITPARTAQQQKIKVCNNFTRPFTGKGFFNKTFPAYGNTGSGYNRVTGALMNLAIVGTYPDTQLYYPYVLISRGPIPAADNASAAAVGSDIFFGWTDNSGTGTAKENDKVVLVAYFPEVHEVIFSINAGIRADCQATLVTDRLHGYAAETWIGFLSNDELDAANSMYAGQVDV